MYMEKVSCTV